MKIFTLLFVLLATLCAVTTGAFVAYKKGPVRTSVIYKGPNGVAYAKKGPYRGRYAYAYKGWKEVPPKFE